MTGKTAGTASTLPEQLKAAGLKLEGQWYEIHTVAGAAKRVLLYGPPGTGKTSAAYYGPGMEILAPETVHVLECHDELMVSEAVGHFIRVGERTMHFDGPVATAIRDSWNGPTTLLIDEIDLAGMALLSKLRGVLNDPRNAKLVIPSRELATASPEDIQKLTASGDHVEILRPHPENFRVVGTMNGGEDDIDGPLWDRFKARYEVRELHPGALARIPAWLREFAAEMAVASEESRISARSWITLGEDLIPAGIPADMAFRAVFGARGDDVRAAIQARIGGPIPADWSVNGSAPAPATPAPVSVAATPAPGIPANGPAGPVVSPAPATPAPVATPAPSGPLPTTIADARAAGIPLSFKRKMSGPGKRPKTVCPSCGNDRQSQMDGAPGAPLVCRTCSAEILLAGGYSVALLNPAPTNKNNKWVDLPGF